MGREQRDEKVHQVYLLEADFTVSGDDLTGERQDEGTAFDPRLP